MNLHEFIHSPAITCGLDASLTEVTEQMDRYNVGSIVVLDAGGAVAGIVTDRDVAIRAVAKGCSPDTAVRDIMSAHVIVVSDDADMFDVAQKMAESGCRRLPVTGKDGALRGVVALDDLMILFAGQADRLAHAVASETTSPLPLP